MRIGLDIDNVITDFDSAILKEFLKEDKNKRNTGIININARHIIKGMFDWSEDEVQDFFNNNMERIARTLKPRKNAKNYMDKLLEDGNELYLISHRAYPHYNHPPEDRLCRSLLFKIKAFEPFLLCLHVVLHVKRCMQSYLLDNLFIKLTTSSILFLNR